MFDKSITMYIKLYIYGIVSIFVDNTCFLGKSHGYMGRSFCTLATIVLLFIDKLIFVIHSKHYIYFILLINKLIFFLSLNVTKK